MMVVVAMMMIMMMIIMMMIMMIMYDAFDIAGQTDADPEELDEGGHAYSQVEAAVNDDRQEEEADDVDGVDAHLYTMEEKSGGAANQSAFNYDKSGPSMMLVNNSSTVAQSATTSDRSGQNTAFIEVDTLRFSSSMPILNMFGQAVTAARSPPLPDMTNNSKYLAMTTDQFHVSSSESDLRKSKSLIDIAKDYAQRERKFRSDNASITIPIKGESVPLFEASEKHRIKDPLLTQVIKPLKYSITRDYA